jgi:zinc/manganese transport system ATP-binding protein
MLAFNGVGLALGHRWLLQGFSAEVPSGALVAVLGPNGAGKTSVLRALAGEIPWACGLIEGVPRRVGYLSQVGDEDRSLPISLLQAASLGLWGEAGAFGALGPSDLQRLGAVLQQLGIAHLANQPLQQLSGGQWQRARFARLLLEQADLLLLDEPFTALDEHTQALLLDVLLRWQQQGKTQWVVLHNPALALAHFPYCLLMGDGTGRFGRTKELLHVGD